MVAGIVIICFSSTTGFCVEVPADSARRVARGVLRHHMNLFGRWNGSLKPSLAAGEIVRYEGETVAFNFQVQPSGHVLVVVDDDLSPVPLYSTTSAFVPGRSHNPNAIESWIVPELRDKVSGLRAFQRQAGIFSAAVTQSTGRSRIRQTWAYFRTLSGDDGAGETSRTLLSESSDMVRSAAVLPLLTTAWGQAVPYNLQTPDDGCSSSHTLTGCVATAWAQLLNYWKWPLQGQGSHSYDWTGDTRNETLSMDFSASTYDWTQMPDILADTSSAAQKNAVSLLMYDLGVAAEMDFGCDTSGSLLWADEVLDTFFKYKPMTPAGNRLEREYYSAAQWFAMFKAELDADPPRPVIFTIGCDLGWHEVVVDGYQTGIANMVHINFGWDGGYNAYYDVNNDANFNTGPFDWYVHNSQLMVRGIEPNNAPPVVNAGSDQIIDEETDVNLSGSATDPEGIGISSYQWTQVSGPTVAITHATSPTATITTPNVHSESNLVFQFRADDANRAYGTDTVTVTVSNTDGSVAPDPPPPTLPFTGGGSSSGGCFIGSLRDQVPDRN